MAASHVRSNEMFDIALGILKNRVGHQITQEDYDELTTAACSIDDALQMASRGQTVRHPAFHRVVETINKVLEPLNRFEKALDTLCQSARPAALIWGSLKIFLAIAVDLQKGSDIITNALEELTDALPNYEEYCALLSAHVECPLRAPLIRIYVEFLTFCVLTTKHTKRSSVKYIGKAVFSPYERDSLELCLAVIRRQSQLISAITIAKTYNAVKDMQTMLSTSSGNRNQATMPLPVRSLSNVPSLLSANFVGRQLQTQWLRDSLRSTDAKYKRKRLAIYGLTGIGKSQLMLKYDETYQTEYRFRFFLICGSRNKLLTSIQEVLDLLDLPERSKSEANLKIAAFRLWLTSEHQWLLMLDNFVGEEYDIVLDLLPLKPNGHVIISSQKIVTIEKLVGGLHSCLELKTPPVNEAVDLFFEISELRATSDNQLLARDIVKEVGMLPHAVDQSASYVKVNNVDLRSYLDQYRSRPNSILDWQSTHTGHRSEISKHFEISLENIEIESPHAAALLRLLSFFEPEEIPIFRGWNRDDPCGLEPKEHFIRRPKLSRLLPRFKRPRNLKAVQDTKDIQVISKRTSDLSGPQLIQEIVKNAPNFDVAIGKLWGLSLLRRTQEKGTLWIHDLTRHFVSQTIPSAERKSWLLAAVEIIFHTFPENDNTLQERLRVDIFLSQAASIVKRAQDDGIEIRFYARLMAMCAQCFHNRGAYTKALEWYSLARSAFEMFFGRDDSRTVGLLHRTALSYYDLGDLKSCEIAHKRVLAIKEKKLGPRSASTLETVMDLAATVERQGRLKEAEPYFMRCYEQQRRELGLDNIFTLACAHNLALCYANQGQLAKAVQLYEMVLQRSEVILGDKHHATLNTLSNLAVAVDHQARLETAELLYGRALEGFQLIFGADHLWTLQVQTNIAGLYRGQCRYEMAESTIRETIGTLLQVLQPHHHHVTAACYDRAEIQHAQGHLHEARENYMLSLGSAGLAGEDHPVQIRSIDALGLLELDAGNINAAVLLSKRAYDANVRVLGWENPYTLTTANDYAECLHLQGTYDEAHALYSKTLLAFQRLAGKDHPYTTMVQNNLGRLAWERNALSQALDLFQKVYATSHANLGEHHICTLTARLNIARSLLHQGHVYGAQDLFAQVTADLENGIIGSRHPTFSVALYFSGIAFATQGSLEEARQSFEAAVTGYSQTLGPDHPNTLLASAMLVRVQRLLHRDNEAAASLSVVETQAALFTSPKGEKTGSLGSVELSLLADPNNATFTWTRRIIMPWGEAIRMRWNGKTWWRDANNARLDD